MYSVLSERYGPHHKMCISVHQTKHTTWYSWCILRGGNDLRCEMDERWDQTSKLNKTNYITHALKNRIAIEVRDNHNGSDMYAYVCVCESARRVHSPNTEQRTDLVERVKRLLKMLLHLIYLHSLTDGRPRRLRRRCRWNPFLSSFSCKRPFVAVIFLQIYVFTFADYTNK